MRTSFDDSDLNDNLLRGIYSYGFENPSIYNVKHYQLLMLNEIIAQAQSGTGKTGAFTIGSLNLLD